MVRPAVYFVSSVAFLLVACNTASTPESVLAVKATPHDATYRILALGLNAQKKQFVAQRQIKRRREFASRVSFADLRSAGPLRSVAVINEQASNNGFVPIATEKAETAFNPLARFNKKLAALKARKRGKPVTILHIGGGHVASDHFSRHIRKALQTRYGDAGRGMVLPAAAFKGASASGVQLKVNSGWRAETALKRGAKKRFGLSGVRVSADSTESFMTLKSTSGRFDWAEVTVATGPHQGAFLMMIGKERRRFNAFSKRHGSKNFRMKTRGKQVTIRPGGIGVTTLLNWTTGKNRRGVRYVNFGLNGASAYTTNRFDMRIVARDIKRLKPDLIVFGYGTNEGFQDKLNLDSYRKHVASYTRRLKSYAPNADLVYIGAASGLRKAGKKQCGSWSIPPKLNAVRGTMRALAAQQKAGFWDWSATMGGACGINAWAGKGLATKGRVRLTSKGYQRSAKAFVNWLVTPPAADLVVAER